MTDEKTVDREIRQILLDPHLLQVLQGQRNDYGDLRLKDTLDKLSYGGEIARSFGFDETVTQAIQIIHDLSRPRFGGVGEAFLLAVDERCTRSFYATQLAKKLLRAVDSPEVQAISDGAARTVLEQHRTAEEMIVCILEYCFAFADSLKERDTALLLRMRYKDLIIEKTAAAGRLTRHEIPENTIPKREKTAFPEEELERRRAVLQQEYQRYLAHPEEIPEAFRNGWDGLEERLIAAFYVAGQPEE